MSKLGPTCQYFVWPPLFYSTALTILGMEFTIASQVSTGVLFHSSMTTSQSWRIWLPFEDAPQITFTLSFFSKAAVVWEVGFGSLSCWNTALWPSLQREGIMLCFSMSQYMLAFMVPLMNCSSLIASSTHAAPDHGTPTTIIDCRQDTLVFVLLTWLLPHTI